MKSRHSGEGMEKECGTSEAQLLQILSPVLGYEAHTRNSPTMWWFQNYFSYQGKGTNVLLKETAVIAWGAQHAVAATLQAARDWAVNTIFSLQKFAQLMVKIKLNM